MVYNATDNTSLENKITFNVKREVYLYIKGKVKEQTYFALSTKMQGLEILQRAVRFFLPKTEFLVTISDFARISCNFIKPAPALAV